MRPGKRCRCASSYHRKGKRPHSYSELYKRWRAAVKAGAYAEAGRLSLEHAQRFAAA